MKIVTGIGVVCATVLVVSCALLVAPIRQAEYNVLLHVMAGRVIRNRNEAAKVDFSFFDSLRNHRWAAARALLTARCQSAVSETMLRDKWQAVEAAYGKNEVWQRDEAHQGLMPDTVDNNYLLRGKTGIAKASLRLVRRDGAWRIDTLTLTP